MTKYLFFLHVENIQLPPSMSRRLNVRMPSTRVADILHVAREVWGFADYHVIEAWRYSPGNPRRYRMAEGDHAVEGEDVWIRGVPVDSRKSECTTE